MHETDIVLHLAFASVISVVRNPVAADASPRRKIVDCSPTRLMRLLSEYPGPSRCQWQKTLWYRQAQPNLGSTSCRVVWDSDSRTLALCRTNGGLALYTSKRPNF